MQIVSNLHEMSKPVFFFKKKKKKKKKKKLKRRLLKFLPRVLSVNDRCNDIDLTLFSRNRVRFAGIC